MPGVPVMFTARMDGDLDLAQLSADLAEPWIAHNTGYTVPGNPNEARLMLRSTLPIEHDPQGFAKPRGVTRDNKWFGGYDGVPRQAILVHFSDMQTSDPSVYSCFKSNDPFTLMHYSVGSHAVLFASSLLDSWQVFHAFPGGLSVLMDRVTQDRVTWRDILLDQSDYVPVPASITHPLPEFAYTIGRHLNRLRYPPTAFV